MINDNVKESEKKESWIESNIKMIYNGSSVTNNEISNQKTFWKYYFNEPDEKKHAFLTKTGDNNQLPVYYYHIPLQRPLIDSLISQQVNRPFNFSISLADKESIEKKYEAQIGAYIEFALKNAETKATMLREFSTQITEQVQEIEGQLQQGYEQMQQAKESGQQVPDEFIQQLSQLEQQLPLIKKQAQKQLENIQKQAIITENDINSIKDNQKLSYRDIKEIIAQKTLLKLREELKVEAKSEKSFTSKVVAGQSMYFVYYNGRTKLPVFEVLNPSNVSYPKIDGISNISKCPWVKIKSYLSVHSIMNNYGQQLVKKYGDGVLNDIRRNYGFSADANMASFPMNGGIFLDDFNDPNSMDNSIEVEKIFYLSNRKTIIKYSPNLNSDNSSDVFRHFIDPNKEIIKKEDYYYKSFTDENGIKKEYYVNKKNKELFFNANDVELYSEKKKESYTEKYTTDRYEGIVIAGKYFIDLRKSNYIVRNADDYSDINLPVFGRTYSSVTERPYSLIDATMDLQDLYDIVYMQRQLMIALSGTKGNVIDRSQKPSDMTDEEWEHNMKLGRLYIQTKDPITGQTINSSYNQWQSFDNTLSPAIQYLDNILVRLEETAGNVIGVGRQRQGKVVPSDQVSTFEMSIQQNELITEVLYYDHDVDEAEALSEALHLALRYCYINNDILDIQTNDYGSDIFQIPANLLNSVQFRVNIINNTKEERTLKDIRNILMASWKSGNASLSQLVDSMTEDSLSELKVKVRIWEEKAAQIASMNRDAEKQSAIEIEQAKAEFNSQLQKELKSVDLTISNNANKIEQKRLEFDALLKDRDLQIRQKIAEDTNKLKLLELLNEDKIETGLLSENKEARMVSNKLDTMQLQINALLEGINLSISKDSSEKSHKENMKKIEVDKQKKMVKEHLNDN